jgi:putative serine protease PepD
LERDMPRRSSLPRHTRLRRIVVGLLTLLGSLPSDSWAQANPPSAPCEESVPQLYQRVSATVVSIGATVINPFDIAHRLDRVSGSGVIIDASGLVLTNAHVVFGRPAITVTLDDGTVLPARLAGADPLFDLAVLRIPQPTQGTLPVATLGDSDKVAVGEEVFAIGNPLGLEQTLTRGIVSAVNRLLPGASLSLTEPLLQTDAAMNPGNSGGPLLNRCGEVIGITTALLPEAQSIGFAVPSALIKAVVPLLLADGRVVRPWFGVQGQVVVPVLKELLRMPLVDGLLVEVVEPGSPAEKAGIEGGDIELSINGQPVLLGGDIITTMNGTTVTDPAKLSGVLGHLGIGDTLKLTVVRGGKPLDLEVTLAERPSIPQNSAGRLSAAPADGPWTPPARPGSGLPGRRWRF